MELMEQNIQERAKYNMSKTAFKKSEVMWSASVDHMATNYLKAVLHEFYLIHS